MSGQAHLVFGTEMMVSMSDLKEKQEHLLIQ